MICEGSLEAEFSDNWAGGPGAFGDGMRFSSFKRPTRNTGAADEARYQIRHVGDLPMFRFG